MNYKICLSLVIILFFGTFTAKSQNRNMVWTFGDSAGINFTNGAVPIYSGIDGRGSCVSISDTSGDLLFYSATSNKSFTLYPNLCYVFDSTHNQMVNGDSIRGTDWYKELIIIPVPNDFSKYYLFSIGVISGPGFSYCTIDMNQNGGLGSVVQKNILLENFNVVDCMSAIKHGNGRDWWLVIRNASMFSNEHYVYLVTPNGISAAFVQSIGSSNNTNLGTYTFSPNGDKLVFTNLIGLMEMYDFNRCTGVISNPYTIHPEPLIAPFGRFWGCEFSASGRFLYISTYDTGSLSALFQYDLWSSNPVGTRDTLEYIPGMQVGNGYLRRGPDQKIYFSRAWECDAFPTCYPYPDSVYNQINMNLSVINYPDSLGTACGYAPYSFYLGGKRTYYGLPNNPDYDLGPFIGSPCDSLTSISEMPTFSTAEFFVYFASDWQTAFINANKLNGSNYHLEVFDLLGKSIFRESGKISLPYFTKNLNCSGFSNGMYVVNFVTDKERLVKRFVVR